MKSVARHFGRLFIDSVSVKELSGISRRWQMYVGRCVYILLIGFVLWLFWWNLTRYSNWMSPSVYAELGRNLFFSFFALQLAVVTLSGVSAGSDMITRELRGRTLGLLALTPLTPWRIVAGKWKAALIQTSTVLLCGAPVFAVCVFLGGVGLWDLTYSLTLSFLCASLGAAVALTCSTLFRAGYVATIVSLIALVAYCALPPVILFGLLDLRERTAMPFLCWTHPMFAAVGAAMPVGLRGAYLNYGWIGATIITSGLILLLLRFCAARVRLLIRRPGSEAPEAPSLDDLGRKPKFRSPRIAFLADLLRGRVGVWETNAILWKELSTRRVGGKAVRIGYFLLAFLLLTSVFDRDWRETVLWFSWCVLILIAVANGVSLFVTEREERKWEILLSTPLKARELVTAKLLAGLAAMAPLALVLSVFWFLTGLTFRAPVGAWAMMLGSVLLTVLLSYLVGAFASLSAQNQRTAFTSAFGVLLGFLVVLPAVMGLLVGVRVLPRGDFIENFIGMTNAGYHLAQFGSMLRSTSWGGWAGYAARRQQEMWSTFQGFVPLYAVMIVGLTSWLTLRFDRATGRS
jgi:ABC-type transport system involved in multi-copper enzyme maturation permease subunit